MATRLTTSIAVVRGLSFSSTSVPKAARMLARRLRRDSGDWGEDSRIQCRRSDPERSARVAAAAPALGEALQLLVVGRHIDFERHQLGAALAVLAGEAAAFEAQHLARRRAFGDG